MEQEKGHYRVVDPILKTIDPTLFRVLTPFSAILIRLSDFFAISVSATIYLLDDFGKIFFGSCVN